MEKKKKKKKLCLTFSLPPSSYILLEEDQPIDNGLHPRFFCPFRFTGQSWSGHKHQHEQISPAVKYVVWVWNFVHQDHM